MISLLAISREDKEEFGIFLDSFLGGTHKELQTFLNGEPANRRDYSIARFFELANVFIESVVVMIFFCQELLVEGVIVFVNLF